MLNLVRGCRICTPENLNEGYEITNEMVLTANVNEEKIADIILHFITMHDEPLFFILELPVEFDREKMIAPRIAEGFHKDVYYIDGCTKENAFDLMDRYGELLINDGSSKFGFGCHESQDEIMLWKYNVMTIYSRKLSEYSDFFESHRIEKVDNLITAWDTFTNDTPGQAKRYDCNGISVFDLPEKLKGRGIYLAKTCAE